MIDVLKIIGLIILAIICLPFAIIIFLIAVIGIGIYFLFAGILMVIGCICSLIISIFD